MENYQGDLADIIRGGGTISGTLGSTTASVTTTSSDMTDHSWQFQTDHHPINYQACNMDDVDDFGHPFSSLRDPLLLSDVDISGGSSTSFFSNSNSLEDDNNTFLGQEIIGNLDHGRRDHPEMKRNRNNYFSKMLQISPNNSDLLLNESPIMVASPRLLKVPASSTLISANDHMISGNSSKATTNCLIENTGLQISSPRNTGIKRRKSQAKKVVCIPAPTPANSRPTGEIVPSDLWAWRKYGQKPIKGSPYPRGYYRCSSSKGCSARKQVERSRTDPNMLVITYTSEHNHPWPTQRNALAGSTRTQPAPKHTKTSPTGGSQSKKSLESSSLKQEQKENNNDIVENSSAIVKVEEAEMKIEDDQKLLTEMEMEDCDQFSKGFPPFESYRPSLPGGDLINNPDQDFFADLGEIESDPLNLLFITQGFDEKLESDDKSLDPFTFYDWTGNTNSSSNNNNKLFGDQRARGL